MQYVFSQHPLLKLFSMVFLLFGLFSYATIAVYIPIIGFAFAGPIVYCILYYRATFFVTCAFIFTLGFGAFLNLPVTSGGFPLSTAILLSAFILWILGALVRKDPELVTIFFRRPEHLLVSGFLVEMVLSLMNSKDLLLSVRQIQLFIYCWVIFFFLQMVLRKREYFEKSIFWVVIAGFVVGMLGILELIIGQPLYWALDNRSLFMADVSEVILNAHAGRINGLVGDAPFHGIYMVVVACLTMYKLSTASSRRGRYGFGIILFVAIINVLLSASRGAVLALALAFLVMWIFLEIRRKWSILAGLALTVILITLATVLIMPEMSTERLYSFEGRGLQTAEMRLSHIPVALNMFFDHPLIGTGPDGFVINYNRYARRFTSNAYQAITMKTHNTFLQILAEYGLIGMILLAALYMLTMKRLWTVVCTPSDQGMKHLALALLGALVAYLFFLFTSNVLVIKNLWMVIALSQCLYTLYEYEQVKLAPDSRVYPEKAPVIQV